MFEKEAEEIAKDIYIHHFDNNIIYPNVLKAITVGVQKGAEFGYNKANEWHYVKDGDFPKSEGSYYVAMDNGRGYKSGAILNWVEETECEEDFHWEDDDYECFDEQVYAWKECPVLPPKETE